MRYESLLWRVTTFLTTCILVRCILVRCILHALIYYINPLKLALCHVPCIIFIPEINKKHKSVTTLALFELALRAPARVNHPDFSKPPITAKKRRIFK